MKYLFILYCIFSFASAMQPENIEENWQTICIKDGQMIINGKPLESTYIQTKISQVKSWGSWANNNPGFSTFLLLSGTFTLGASTGATAFYLYQKNNS